MVLQCFKRRGLKVLLNMLFEKLVLHRQDGFTPPGITPQDGITLQKLGRLACASDYFDLEPGFDNAVVLTAPRLRVSQNAAAPLIDVLEMFFC